MEEVKRPSLTAFQIVLITFSLSLSTFMYALDYTIANVAIPYICGDLSVSKLGEGTYIITFFSVGNAVVLPLTGWLTKRVGAVRLQVISTLLFSLVSFLCSISVSYGMLVVFRFLQGAVTGPIIPISQSLLATNYPPEKRSSAMAFFGTIVVIAPVFGPVIGGWIVVNYHWSWIFLINVPLGIISAWITWKILKDKETEKEKAPGDLLGLSLLLFGIVGLQILLDKGEQWDWLSSNKIRFLAVVALVCLTYLILYQLIKKKPLLDLRLFKIKSFTLSIIILVIFYGTYFGQVVLVPLWLQTFMGYNAYWAGLAVASLGIVPAVFGSFTGKIVDKIGAIPTLGLSVIFFSISGFYSCFFNTQVDVMHIAISRGILGIGLLFLMTPLLILCIQDIDDQRLPSATGIFHCIRALSGSVATSLFATAWERRIQFHHLRLASHVTLESDNSIGLFKILHHLGIRGESSLDIMNLINDKQAAMLALNDIFWLMGWMCLGALIILPFMWERKKGKLKRKVEMVSE